MITDPLLEGSPMKLKKLVALVTGASSGIGKATAERLATAGYKVYGTSRHGATPGPRSFEMLSLDVTSDESVAAAVNALLRSEGRLDLLVNNAGEVGGSPRPPREQRGLQRCPRRGGRELDRTGARDLRDDLLRDRPDDA